MAGAASAPGRCNFGPIFPGEQSWFIVLLSILLPSSTKFVRPRALPRKDNPGGRGRPHLTSLKISPMRAPLPQVNETTAGDEAMVERESDTGATERSSEPGQGP